MKMKVHIITLWDDNKDDENIVHHYRSAWSHDVAM